MTGDRAKLVGRVPASEVQDYALEVAAYTSGRGHLYLEFAGYAACHDAERVIETAAYEPEADLPNTPDSVFCSHGAGYTVKWYDVPAAAHVEFTHTSAPGEQQTPSSSAIGDRRAASLSPAVGITRYKLV